MAEEEAESAPEPPQTADEMMQELMDLGAPTQHAATLALCDLNYRYGQLDEREIAVELLLEEDE